MKLVTHRTSEDGEFEFIQAYDDELKETVVNLGIGNVMITLFADEFENLLKFLEELK